MKAKFYYLKFDLAELEELLENCKKLGLKSAYSYLEEEECGQDNITTFRLEKFKGKLDPGGSTADPLPQIEHKSLNEKKGAVKILSRFLKKLEKEIEDEEKS